MPMTRRWRLSPILSGRKPTKRISGWWEETRDWVLSPERKAPQKEREYAAARLDGVISKIKSAMQSALSKIQKKLMQPEVKQAGKQQIQEKAKESILAFLKKAKQDSAQRESNRKKQQKKQDMEL